MVEATDDLVLLFNAHLFRGKLLEEEHGIIRSLLQDREDENEHDFSIMTNACTYMKDMRRMSITNICTHSSEGKALSSQRICQMCHT